MGKPKTKECTMCTTLFFSPDGSKDVCSHACHLERRRAWHRKNGDRLRKEQRDAYHNGRKAYYRLYEKTVTGLLMRMYRNMQSRVTGVQHKKAHLYKGKCLLPRASFYEWAHGSDVFQTLYDAWKKSGYSRKLTPSVDRINSETGYELSNMEWTTHSENSRRGAIARHSRKQVKI